MGGTPTASPITATNDKGEKIQWDGTAWKPAAVVHTATNDKGEKIQWDGKAWNPVKAADSSNPITDTLKSVGKALIPSREDVAKGVLVTPTQAGIERVATGLMAGGPAAEAGEAIIGLGMVGRAAGIGLLNGIQQLWEKPSDPMQAVKATGWGMGLGLAGEAATSVATKTAAAVAPYAKSVASKVGEMTPNRVKALFHIQEFAKAAGRSPEEIEALTKGVEAQGQFADAHQKILDVTAENFHQRYDEILGKPEVKELETATSAVPQKAGAILSGFEKDNRLQQMSPGVRKFIGDQASGSSMLEDIVSPADYKAMSAADRAAAEKAIAEGNRIIYTSKSKGMQVIQPSQYQSMAEGGQSVDQLRGTQSQIRSMLRKSSSTPTDRAALNELHNAVSDEIDGVLTQAGAKPEDLAQLRNVDRDYRRTQLTLNQIGDPRKALTGAQAAQAIFDAADSKNYGAVDQYIKLAKAASEVHPEVMTDLKDAMLTKMFADAAESSAKAQTGAAGMASSLRQQASVLRSMAPDTAETLFGKGSPMADKRAADKIFGALGDPAKKEQAIAGVASGASKSAMFRRYAGRALIIGGAIGAATGKSGSLYSLANKVDPMTAIALGVGVLYGPETARFVFGRTGVAAQKAYTNWLLEPGNPERFQQMVDGLSAAAGRGVEETNDTNAPANP
jgi:hypothetical protein